MTLPELAAYKKPISDRFSEFVILFWNKVANNSEEKMTGVLFYPGRVD